MFSLTSPLRKKLNGCKAARIWSLRRVFASVLACCDTGATATRNVRLRTGDPLHWKTQLCPSLCPRGSESVHLHPTPPKLKARKLMNTLNVQHLRAFANGLGNRCSILLSYGANGMILTTCKRKGSQKI